MPIYEYRCSGCGCLIERYIRAASFASVVECPTCSADAHKIISLPQRPIVDNTDREGFNYGAGRYFSNKREVREYCRANNVIAVGNEGYAKAKEELAAMRAAKAQC